ncbi:MAG: hypothetical protein Q7V57_14665 [Actinomycetota bacterium]|nr:hypothetical protein [Actinomycetota bacterium]
MPEQTTPTSQAAELRRLATRLQHLRLLTVHRLAGGDTWVGPPAQACHDALRRHAMLVVNQAEHLLAVARRLEWEPQP